MDTQRHIQNVTFSCVTFSNTPLILATNSGLLAGYAFTDFWLEIHVITIVEMEMIESGTTKS